MTTKLQRIIKFYSSIPSWTDEVKEKEKSLFFSVIFNADGFHLGDKANSFPTEKQPIREFLKSMPLVVRDPVTQASGQPRLSIV